MLVVWSSRCFIEQTHVGPVLQQGLGISAEDLDACHRIRHGLSPTDIGFIFMPALELAQQHDLIAAFGAGVTTWSFLADDADRCGHYCIEGITF